MGVDLTSGWAMANKTIVGLGPTIGKVSNIVKEENHITTIDNQQPI